MPERPTLADVLLGRVDYSRGLPSGELSRADRDRPLVLGTMDVPPPPPPERVDALTPQTREESERLTHTWRNALPYMAWTMPPVAAYLGGRRIGQGWEEGDLLGMGLGAGQAAFALPGVFNAAISASRAIASRTPRTLPMTAAERGLAEREVDRVLGYPGVSAETLAARAGRSSPTSGQRDFHALPPHSAESAMTRLDDPLRAQRFWDAIDEFAALRPPPPRPPPRTPLDRGVDELGALQPGAAFPRIEGTTAEDARNAYMALRQSGNYDEAIRFLGGNRPGAESLLRAWQARGVDAGQALRYWQGLAGLRDLERPTRLNSLAPLGVAAGGLGATDTNLWGGAP